MSVLGFDLSTDHIRVAIISEESTGYNDVKNSDEEYGTPAAVSFDRNQRIVGRLATKRGNCFADIMKVVGKNKADLKSDAQLSSLLEKGPSDLLLCVPDILPGVRFTPTHLLAMVFSDLKAMAENAVNADNVKECCLGVPACFSASQQDAVCQAAKIAGFSEVSVATTATATAIGYSLIMGNLPKQGTRFLATIDIDRDTMQITIISLNCQSLEVLSHVLNSSTSDLKVLFQKAVAQAGKGMEDINTVLVMGSGANISATEKSLEGLFPKQAGAAGIKVISSVGLVARGCAILCATRSNNFQARKSHHKLQSMKDCKFKVTDKLPPIKDKVIEVQVNNDGRVELTGQEIFDAREYEKRIAMREKLRTKIHDLLQLNEFARKGEIATLEKAKNHLDNDNLDEEYNAVTIVEKSIRARNDEHRLKNSMIKKFRKRIATFEKYFKSEEPIYRTIQQTAKDSLKEKCKQQRKWLDDQCMILSRQTKLSDPINFIKATTSRIGYLDDAWAAAQQQRDPEIVKLTYTITPETFISTIDEFRLELLKGVLKKTILGCFMLPFQTEVNRVPCKWFQVKLIGRNDEFTVLHVKHHNVYNVAFGNMEGQVFEMGPGNEDEGQLQLMDPGHESTGLNIPEVFRLTIVGAKYAGFSCDYISMLNPDKLPWSKEEKLKKFVEFKVGIDPWLDSIHVLGYNDDAEHYESCPLCQAPNAVPRAVMCISIMLNECTRMDGLKNPVNAGMFGMNLIELLVRYIWLWKVMSELLRRWDLDNKETEVPPAVSVHIGGSHINAVALIMHLVLNTIGAGKVKDTKDHRASSQTSSGGDDGDKKEGEKKAGPSSPSAHGRNGANNEHEQSQPQVGPGQNLLQIFSVTPKRIKLDDIHGILIHEERGCHAIYSYGGGSISKRKGFRLSGPRMSISSESGCLLEIVPKSGNKYGATKDALMQLDDGCSNYNQSRKKIMPYGDGILEISYAILTGAVEATLQIYVQLPSSRQTPSVAGLLKVDQEHGMTILSVVRAVEQPVRARRFGLPDPSRSMSVYLQLAPSVLAVKLGSSVKVEGTLSIANKKMELCQVLVIPTEVDIIENVKMPWVHDSNFSHSVSMTLISRNI